MEGTKVVTLYARARAIMIEAANRVTNLPVE